MVGGNRISDQIDSVEKCGGPRCGSPSTVTRVRQGSRAVDQARKSTVVDVRVGGKPHRRSAADRRRWRRLGL